MEKYVILFWKNGHRRKMIWSHFDETEARGFIIALIQEARDYARSHNLGAFRVRILEEVPK